MSAVPEPTKGEVDCVLEAARIAILNGGPTALTLDERCVIGLARRCRELEAANKEHWPATGTPEQVESSHQKRDVLYQLCKKHIGDKPNQWLSEAAIETIEKLEADAVAQRDMRESNILQYSARIADLEAEVDRLKHTKCVHDLAREFSRETTNDY